MHFTSIFASLVAIASMSSAAAIPIPELDAYIGDLRTFSAIGCSSQNQGIGTYTQSMTGACNLYSENFNSLYIHITPGWAFRAHKESDCRDEGTIIAKTAVNNDPIICNNQTLPWVAYSVKPLVAGEIQA
ncbi:hypothetical protein GGR54DRAFT_502279 [Hypoxylon sp. NC1633]|nr:hypothetical protein GGR54DRAFT_502279 [Hypoxylon sp. NC1633]